MQQLSKEQMKNVKGGMFAAAACSMTYQDSGGGWHTENGSCDNFIGWGFYIPFCHTASFSSPTPLSSNGGVSACGAAVYGA